jgi:NDP-sugar pyrophosphorylase family protein
MILAAGLGTRLRPLTDLRAKPALPVQGRPVIACLLELLHHHGIREVLINLHHRPASIEAAVEGFAPEGMSIRYSREPAPLGTGGGIRRARDFLCESETSLVLAGDMLLDMDLGALIAHHRRAESTCTLVLRRDPRDAQFGTIGLDASGTVRRIGSRFDLGGGDDASGVFIGVRVFSRSVFGSMPERDSFEDLSDWLAPDLERGVSTIRGLVLEPGDCVWEPVGTPTEYLNANFSPPALSFLRPTFPPAQGTHLMGAASDVILGTGSKLGKGAKLERCVVWEDERVPADFRGSGGVFAGGNFYALSDVSSPMNTAGGDGEQIHG